MYSYYYHIAYCDKQYIHLVFSYISIYTQLLKRLYYVV